MEKVRYRVFIDENSGRRKGWAKEVKAVEPNCKNGYGIEGDFLEDDTEYEFKVGSVILHVDPKGPNNSRAWKRALIILITPEGPKCMLKDTDWQSDFLTVRDKLIELLEGSKDQQQANDQARLDALKDYSIEELMAEVERRKGLDAK